MTQYLLHVETRVGVPHPPDQVGVLKSSAMKRKIIGTHWLVGDLPFLALLDLLGMTSSVGM